MAGFSGKKYPVYKVRDPAPDNVSHQITGNTGTNPMYNNPRSGKKYLPVRISTANFDNLSGSKNSASNRKTTDLSSRKPIRNLHKLFESPKRTARKRLDNLYDYSKPNENSNPTTVRAQAPSTKKLGPKTPVVVISARKSSSRTSLFTSGNKSRRSKLLPPGTITGSYVKGRNSLAPRTSLCKLPNTQHTVAHKNLQTKRPSDVLEESPQPLESSYNSSGDADKRALQNHTTNKLTEALEKIEKNGLIRIDKQTSPLINSEDETGKLIYCCKCSRTIQKSNPANGTAAAADENVKILVNSEEIVQENLLRSKNNVQEASQRPTVIVMQKETAPQLTVENSDEWTQNPVQDGSYSEILGLQPSANDSAVDASLLFKRMEKACSSSENIQELKGGSDEISESIFELISSSREVLVEQHRVLSKSISESEENLKTLKLALKNVDAQLNKHEMLASSSKLKGWSNFKNAKFSLTVNDELKKNLMVQSSNDNCESSSKEDLESDENTNQSKWKKKQSWSRKSVNVESQVEEERNNGLPEDLSKQSNQGDDTKENIENQPPQRRRSARLAIKNGDLSLPVEQSTPMTGKKNSKTMQASKSKPFTPNMTTPTPARSVRWGRRRERPLREYMVIKSAIKFLNTPDSRQYLIQPEETVQIHESLGSKTDQVIVSDKLLNELHDLYATP